MQLKYKDKTPTVSPKAYLIGDPFLAGDVRVGDYASIWPMVAARGDVDKIVIGSYTNIQDGSVLHCDGGSPLLIGDYVTVGHCAMLHGCTIGDRVLVGIGATVLSGAVVEEDVMIGAGALVTGGKTLKSGKLYVGSPARAVRDLKPEELEFLKKSAHHYVEIAENYKI